MSSEPKSPTTSPTSTILTFFALYFTTLFSLDTWDAARGSPHRLPGTGNTYFRPAQTTPSPDSYQGQMFRGNNGGGARRDVGRVPTARDSRPPLGMGATAACGACMH